MSEDELKDMLAAQQDEARKMLEGLEKQNELLRMAQKRASKDLWEDMERLKESIDRPKHGPHVPCKDSPTGSHCEHRVEVGAIMPAKVKCCWCGNESCG